MAKCLITNCSRENVESEFWCLPHLVKFQVHNNLLSCSFCWKNEVPADKNFYILNRYKAQFWNQKYPPTSFICFDCLYDTREIEIMPSKKGVYRTYKWRYCQQSRNKPSKLFSIPTQYETTTKRKGENYSTTNTYQQRN